MPIQLGQQPQAGFDDPLGLMMDCHRRIEYFLDVLLKVVDARQGAPLDDEHRRALQAALDYFRHAAPKHTADEEASLFPRLQRVNSPAAREAMAQLDRLEADHRVAEQLHANVDAFVTQWLNGNALGNVQVQAMRRALMQLKAAYVEHIAIEDTQVFPLARQLLTDEQLRRVGAEFKSRRDLA